MAVDDLVGDLAALEGAGVDDGVGESQDFFGGGVAQALRQVADDGAEVGHGDADDLHCGREVGDGDALSLRAGGARSRASISAVRDGDIFQARLVRPIMTVVALMTSPDVLAGGQAEVLRPQVLVKRRRTARLLSSGFLVP